MQKLAKKHFIILFSFLTFILMSTWATLTPKWADDLCFSRKSFHEIIKSSCDDYLYWNGRFFGQTLSKIFSNIPSIIYGLIIGFTFTLLSLLILKLSESKNNTLKNNNIRYFFILLSLFLFTPNFSQVFLWRSGTGNYLALSTITLLFLVMFLTNNPSLKNKSWLIIPSCILGFVAGLSNENTPGGILIIIIFYLAIGKIKINYQKMLPIFFMVVGYIILLVSPGSRLRSLTHSDFMKMNIFKKIYTNLPITNNFMMSQLYWISIIFIVLCITNIVIVKNKAYITALAYFVAGLAVIYVLNVSPEGSGEGRACFGGFVLMVIACSKLIDFDYNDKYLLSLQSIILTIMTILTFINLTNGIIDSHKTNSAINSRNELIKQNKNHSDMEIKKLPYYGKGKYSITYGLSDLRTDPNYFVNTGYENEFHINKVVLKNNSLNK
ncbi:DUF6056 family protein [Fructilactobacillus sp. Tb1]|uniref:DUF6056 family protein n=1 Tax=Fructilactobacillus sp. Tb1 TaxID=3422304 RepID=UPI003D26710F